MVSIYLLLLQYHYHTNNGCTVYIHFSLQSFWKSDVVKQWYTLHSICSTPFHFFAAGITLLTKCFVFAPFYTRTQYLLLFFHNCRRNFFSQFSHWNDWVKKEYDSAVVLPSLNVCDVICLCCITNIEIFLGLILFKCERRYLKNVAVAISCIFV